MWYGFMLTALQACMCDRVDMSVCMSVGTYVYVCVCIVCIRVCMYMYTFIYVYVYVQVYVHTHTHTHTHRNRVLVSRLKEALNHNEDKYTEFRKLSAAFR